MLDGTRGADNVYTRVLPLGSNQLPPGRKYERKIRTKDKRPMPEDSSNATPPVRNSDEVALEMMKFIAVTTGYGKGGSAAGFAGKGSKTPEEFADALLQLFERCRTVINKEKA
jgi:hypothetical protein